MAIDNINKLVKGLAESKKLRFYKPNLLLRTTGEIASLWTVNGFPSLGFAPTTSATCNKNLEGSWDLPVPSGNNKLYIGKVSASSSVSGQFLLFDRLCHMGGLSGVSILNQEVNLNLAEPTLQGRCEQDGAGVLWCLEWYADTGATARTLRVTYTNQNGISGRNVDVPLLATRRRGFVQPIVPNDSDTRIISIESVMLNASTGTVGNFGITARRRIAALPMTAIGVGFVADYASLALPELQGMECLEILWVCGTTSTGNILGSMEIIEG